MMKPEDVTVGMKVRCGIDLPREATVIATPKQDVDSVRVRVKFVTGDEYDAPIWMISAIAKRPSARRVSLKDIALEFARWPGSNVTPEKLRDFFLKGGGK